MQYDVKYQMGLEERTDRIEADTAADAAEQVRNAHAGSNELFELLLVHLLDEAEENASRPAVRT